MGFRLTLRPALEEGSKRWLGSSLTVHWSVSATRSTPAACTTPGSRLKMWRAIVRLVRDPLGSPAMCACAEIL